MSTIKALDMLAVNRIEKKAKRKLTEFEIECLRNGETIFVQSSKSHLFRSHEVETFILPSGVLDSWQCMENSSSTIDPVYMAKAQDKTRRKVQAAALKRAKELGLITEVIAMKLGA